MSITNNKKCEYSECTRKIDIYFGLCKLCEQNYCKIHYRLDNHKCKEADKFYAKKKEQLKHNILSQKCLSEKIIRI